MLVRVMVVVRPDGRIGVMSVMPDGARAVVAPRGVYLSVTAGLGATHPEICVPDPLPGLGMGRLEASRSVVNLWMDRLVTRGGEEVEA